MKRSAFFHLLAWLRGERLAILCLAVFYLVSVGLVWKDRYIREDAAPDEITIRFCHWQLETSVREGFDWLAEEYRKLRPNVRVVQMGVGGNGGAYNQWLTTQLLGGTAPDLVEIPGLLYPIMVTFCSRYFVPLSEMTARPNPFNAGTDLEGVPLRETFIDNLQCAYVPELLDFYGLPMTIVNCRMYYNRRLLQRLTGRDEPPDDLRGFLETCRAIAAQDDELGRPYVPISGSQFSYSVLRPWVMSPLSHGAVYLVDGALDENADGYYSQDELYFAWAKGILNLREDPFRLSHEALRRVVDQFQPGWNAMDRDQSLFMFVQERAVFIPTGTWDYRSLASQAGFELGIFEIPVPSFDDPEYGHAVFGPVFERPQADARFALNKNSRHLAEATEFLLWFMSQRTNEEFCRRIGWLPSIRGAEIPGEMIPFQARMNGVQGPVDFSMGNQTNVIYEQQRQLYMLGKMTYEELVRAYEKDLARLGRQDFNERTGDIRRSIFSREATTAQMRGRLFSTSDPEARERIESKYYEFACDQSGIPGYVLYRNRLLEKLDEEKKRGEAVSAAGR